MTAQLCTLKMFVSEFKGQKKGNRIKGSASLNISNNHRVNDFLSDIKSLSNNQSEIVLSIRDLFLDASEGLDEDIKYGGIVFSLSKGLLGGIYVYKEHISIEFSNGADFTDTDSILEGSGKHRRHLKIYSPKDVAQKKSGDFINQAV